MEFQRRGVMLVIASPSGAGKSSISRALFGADPNIRLSVSVTTRARRTDEVDGKHYHFIDVPTYQRISTAPPARASKSSWRRATISCSISTIRAPCSFTTSAAPTW
jgi:predicted GTPase